jgi:hypothetical protein
MAFAAFIVCSLLAAQTRTSTGDASAIRVELITVGTGKDVRAPWGHAAVRIYDPDDESDLAYDFGPVDLGGVTQPSRRPFGDLLASWSGDDRTITRRVLALSDERAHLLKQNLEARVHGAKSERAAGDASTDAPMRILAEIDGVLDHEIRASFAKPVRGSYRSRSLQALRSRTLPYVLLDLAFSGALDRPLKEWDTAFLPDGLAALLDRVLIGGKRLVDSERDLARTTRVADGEPWTWPWVKIYVLLLVPMLALIWTHPRLGAWSHAILLSPIGLFALIAALLFPEEPFGPGWMLVLFPPTHVLVLRIRSARGRRLYFALHGAALIAVALCLHQGVITRALGPALGLALPPSLLLALIGPRGYFDQPVSVRT